MFCEIRFYAKEFQPRVISTFLVTFPATDRDITNNTGNTVRPPNTSWWVFDEATKHQNRTFLMHNVLQTSHVSYTATLFDKGVDTVCVPHTRHQPEVLLCHQWGISSLLGLPGRRHTALVMVLVQWRPHCQEIMTYQRDHQNQKALFFFCTGRRSPVVQLSPKYREKRWP